jgi:hypothetical protein
MPDYRKTEELFKAEGVLHLYKKPLGQLDDELFYAKVTNLATNTFYQVSGLPLEYRKNLQSKTYPVREVYQIYRIKRVNGSEWLKSRGRIVGLDRLGNEVEHSFTDPEMFYKPVTRYEFGKKDPKNEYNPSERVCVEAGINPHDDRYTEYSLPFNQENFESLYKQRPTESSSSVSLVIFAEGASERPRQITNPEHFAKRDFDEMWEEMVTPKFKLDRSYKDNLEACHIG